MNGVVPAHSLVTVLMPVYNGAPYVGEAIESILRQSFTDFEFLIINDGSTDGSADIVRTFADQRIRLLEHTANLGLIATLNHGLAVARGKYVARMDCDDISLPQRLEKQCSFMDMHPEFGICGTWVKTFDGAKDVTIRFPTEPDKIRCITMFNSCISHPSIMIRSAALKQYRIFYNPLYPHAEDYALWVEAMRHFQVANIGEVLHLYRQHPGQVTVQHLETQTQTIFSIRRELIADLGVEPTDKDFALHCWLASPTLKYARNLDQDVCRELMESCDRWFEKLRQANDERQIYPQPDFSAMLFRQWFIICAQVLIAKGPRMLKYFRFLIHLDSLGLKRSYLLRHVMGIVATGAENLLGLQGKGKETR